MNTNENKLGCPRCKCVIYKERSAILSVTSTKISLKYIEKNKQEELEECQEFWTVTDMMAFENIGFSKQVEADGGLKYLICADCDLGPLGYHNPSEKPYTFNIVKHRVTEL